MDILTHVFLPLVVLIIFKEQIHEKPIYLIVFIGFFGVLSDFDKFLGIPGFLHSFLTLSLVVVVIFLIEYSINRKVYYSIFIALLLYSHLFLDILDSSPVAFLYPLTDTTFYLEFPLKIDFNHFNFSFMNFPIKIVFGETKFIFKSYSEVLTGYGVTSLILFIIIYLGLKKTKNKELS